MNKFVEDIEKNIKILSIQEWKKMLSSELSFIFTTRTYNFNPKFLYRARLNLDCNKKPIDLFTHADNLWAPDTKYICRDGRCNVTGQSTLYCATSVTTTLFEIKPNIGAELTFMDFDVLEKIENLGIIGYKDIIMLGDDYKEIFGQHFNECSKDAESIDNTLSVIFKSNHTEQYPIYNLTNAIYQFFTDKPQNEILPDFLKLPKVNGLIYPSIATNKLLGINIAMDPDSVKTLLKPYKAYIYKVLYKYDEHRYVMIQTHMTDNINEIGEMSWVKNDKALEEFITDLPIDE